VAPGASSQNHAEDGAEDKHERNEARMITQREVLTFITKRPAEGRGVSAQDLAGEFWLSLDAACGQLKRLWRERLIEATSFRPPRFRFRLEPGEPILPLRFRLTARGRERLRWYERQDDNRGGLLLFR